MSNEKDGFTKIGSLDLEKLVEQALDVLAPYLASGIKSGKFMRDVGGKRALDIGGLVKELIMFSVDRYHEDEENEECLLNAFALLVTANLHNVASRMKDPPDIMVGEEVRDELFRNRMN